MLFPGRILAEGLKPPVRGRGMIKKVVGVSSRSLPGAHVEANPGEKRTRADFMTASGEKTGPPCDPRGKISKEDLVRSTSRKGGEGAVYATKEREWEREGGGAQLS